MNRKKFIQDTAFFGGLSLLAFLVSRKFGFTVRVQPSELGEKKRLIEELVETIIPHTDTPGAKEAGVADFVIDIIQHCTVPQEQKTFINGLRELEEYSYERYGQSFMACSALDRIAVLTHFENQAVYLNPIVNKVKRRLFGQSFILKLKMLAAEGYCTSEKGATQGLVYDFVPITYEPCMTLAPGQRAWALK